MEQPWETYLNLWQALLQPDPVSAAADKSLKATNSTISSSSSSKGSIPAVKSSRRSSSKAAGLRLGQQSSGVGNASHDQWALQQQAVYDALLRAVLDVLHNLDLGYQQADSSAPQDASVKLNSPDAKSVTRQVSAWHIQHVLLIQTCQRSVTCCWLASTWSNHACADGMSDQHLAACHVAVVRLTTVRLKMPLSS